MADLPEWKHFEAGTEGWLEISSHDNTDFKYTQSFHTGMVTQKCGYRWHNLPRLCGTTWEMLIHVKADCDFWDELDVYADSYH